MNSHSGNWSTDSLANMSSEKYENDKNSKSATNVVDLERTRVIVDMMSNARTPLMSVGLVSSLLDIDKDIILKALRANPETENVADNLEMSLDDLRSAVQNLEMVIDSSLTLGESLLSNQEFKITGDGKQVKKQEIPVHCNMLRKLDHIQATVNVLDSSSNIKWEINQSLLSNGNHFSYPEAMEFVLLAVLERAVTMWSHIKVKVYFRSRRTSSIPIPAPADSTSIQEKEKAKKQTLKGLLVIEIRAADATLSNNDIAMSRTGPGSIICDRENNNIVVTPGVTESKDISSQMNLTAIDLLLKSIGGGSRISKLSSISSNSLLIIEEDPDNRSTSNTVAADTTTTADIDEQLFEFFFPCNIITTKNTPTSTTTTKKLDINNITYENNTPFTNNMTTETNVVALNGNKSDLESSVATGGFLHAQENPEKSDFIDHTTASSRTGSNITSVTVIDTSGPPTSSSTGNTSPTRTTINTINNDKRLSVLVVDDSGFIQRMLRRWLESHGCDVSVANNGKIGLELMKQQYFDVVFMDFLMPVMLGREAIKSYCQWKKDMRSFQVNTATNENVLIIGMSANSSTEEQDDGFDNGMHYFATKPIDINLLTIILAAKRSHELIDDAIHAIHSNTGLLPELSDNRKPSIIGDATANYNYNNDTRSESDRSVSSYVQPFQMNNPMPIQQQMHPLVLQDKPQQQHQRRRSSIPNDGVNIFVGAATSHNPPAVRRPSRQLDDSSSGSGIPVSAIIAGIRRNTTDEGLNRRGSYEESVLNSSKNGNRLSPRGSLTRIHNSISSDMLRIRNRISKSDIENDQPNHAIGDFEEGKALLQTAYHSSSGAASFLPKWVTPKPMTVTLGFRSLWRGRKEQVVYPS